VYNINQSIATHKSNISNLIRVSNSLLDKTPNSTNIVSQDTLKEQLIFKSLNIDDTFKDDQVPTTVISFDNTLQDDSIFYTTKIAIKPNLKHTILKDIILTKESMNTLPFEVMTSPIELVTSSNNITNIISNSRNKYIYKMCD
jgi:hypothetical protein